jgi:class 3 adenylate cyclase
MAPTHPPDGTVVRFSRRRRAPCVGGAVSVIPDRHNANVEPSKLRGQRLKEVRRLRARQAAPAPIDRAERRQLTLLFCDLEDSVGLSTRLDPEDLRDLIVAYQGVCAAAIERYDGYVARYVGDGILAYFGYPVAHEDNAERAIRAGLDLVAAVVQLKKDQFPDLSIRVRVGIATGMVVVGDANAESHADHGSVVGEAANLAARLQGFARPDTVVVSDVTRQLAMEGFDYRDLGGQSLKGFAAPVPVYQVIGPRDVTRLEARGSIHTPFVGRHEEAAIFTNRWKHALAGAGQFLMLIGPAGIGKSRVVAEAIERIREASGSAVAPIILQCSPYHANTPLHPVVRYLLRRAGIESADPSDARRAKIARVLAEAGRALDPDPARLSLLAELAGDLLLSVDGVAIEGADDLIRLLNAERIGRDTVVAILRGGAVEKRTVVPVERR